MKFNTLKENYENKDGYTPKLQINTFIKFMDKVDLLEELKSKCLDVNANGVYSIDYITKTMLIDLFFIRNCSNIELDESVDASYIDQYDFLIEKGLIEKIKFKIQDERIFEYTELHTWCDSTLEQEVRVNNSIEGIVANGIQSLINKIPNEESLLNIAKSIKDIEPSKFKMIKELFDFTKSKKK